VSDDNLDMGIVKYVQFDAMLGLWLKIMQIGYLALKSHSRIAWPSVQ